MGLKSFTIFWHGGKREVVEGETIADAFTRAGYGAGALRAVDYYENDDVDEDGNPVTDQSDNG